MFKTVKKEDLPKKFEAKEGQRLTLGDLRACVAAYPDLKWLSLSWSDEGGFDSGLACDWIYYIDNDSLHFLTTTDCPCYGHDLIEHKYFLKSGALERQISMQGKDTAEWMAQLEGIPDDIPLFINIKINKSRFGKHWAIPFEMVGHEVFTNGHDERFIQENVLGMSAFAYTCYYVPKTKVSTETSEE